MRLSELKSSETLLTEELRRDPAFAAEWKRTALARAVAIQLIAYRNDHALSQAELAARLEMEQPQVARLESGDVNPRLETLTRISGALGIEFNISIRPAAVPSKLANKRATRDPLAAYESDGSDVSVSAA